ncbi:MAG TPA: FAD-linked oxidase C-terminal domain-containing protein [Trebonia sp.]|jgi:FAD/FMN-containing dehydrogenase/Fe-S oxidoreductase
MTTTLGRRHAAVSVTDRGRLAHELTKAIAGEVRFDQGALAVYANDASVYRQVPIGVVIPRDAADVVAAVAVCRDHEVPILGRGCGTALAGQSVNAAVVFDFSKYMRDIVRIDPQARTARVQPGVICDQLRDAAAEHGLTFAVDPATHSRCTLGGMIGNNSCGTHSVMGGTTADNVLELDVLTYDGTRMTVGPTTPAEYQRIQAEGGRRAEIYRELADLGARYGPLVRERFPKIPRRISGYNLDDLLPGEDMNVARALTGTEGTCVLILEATVRLLPNPPAHALLVIGHDDAPTAADHVPGLLTGDGLIGLECFDQGIIDNIHKHGEHMAGIDELPPGGAWLLAEYSGDTQDEANTRAESAMRGLAAGNPKVVEDPTHESEVWEIRRSGCEYTRIPGEHGGLPAWEDSGVPPERLGDFLREFCRLIGEHGMHTVLFGHFGQGCAHTRLDPDLQTADGIKNFLSFIEATGDLIVKYGGSLTGEHGDGQLRANQLVKMYGPELVGAFAEFKRIFDPDGKMNPGKVVAPYRPDQNLQWGADYRPRHVETHFRFPQDDMGFADAVNRCFGIGLCRRPGGGTMCPSFMVTKEEIHSTRGRARLLFEMMSGLLQDKGWRDPNVKEALDLCLACKGCKGDCPVSVDMASYKAEFLAHYYHRRVRPRQAYALGLIPVWAKLGSRAPGLANAALSAPLLGQALKLAAGVAPARQAPPLAPVTFRQWFARHQSPADGTPVLLWPDTFTNYFSPEIGVAAVQVLEQAGCRVQLPTGRTLCCGRPLYDYGMLPTARRWLGAVLEQLREPLAAGLPVVGLEPSCVAVFRDELVNLMPDDLDARRLSQQAMTLGEFLGRSGYQAPPMAGQALVQVHCHHGAVLTFGSERTLLRDMGLELDEPPSGCCGLAGSFGFERGEHYDVSMAAGERVILPAVRDAAPQTLIVADGFSCREQIAHGTARRALHLAQVLRLAALGGQPQEHTAGAGQAPEDLLPAEAGGAGPRPRSTARLAALAGGAGVAAVTAIAIRSLRGGSHG